MNKYTSVWIELHIGQIAYKDDQKVTLYLSEKSSNYAITTKAGIFDIESYRSELIEGLDAAIKKLNKQLKETEDE